MSRAFGHGQLHLRALASSIHLSTGVDQAQAVSWCLGRLREQCMLHQMLLGASALQLDTNVLGCQQEEQVKGPCTISGRRGRQNREL